MGKSGFFLKIWRCRARSRSKFFCSETGIGPNNRHFLRPFFSPRRCFEASAPAHLGLARVSRRVRIIFSRSPLLSGVSDSARRMKFAGGKSSAKNFCGFFLRLAAAATGRDRRGFRFRNRKSEEESAPIDRVAPRMFQPVAFCSSVLSHARRLLSIIAIRKNFTNRIIWC